jgi:hypothetical protein
MFPALVVLFDDQNFAGAASTRSDSFVPFATLGYVALLYCIAYFAGW